MKINKRTHKKILLSSLTVLVLLAGVGSYWVYTTQSRPSQSTESKINKIDYSPSTSNQEEAGENQKQTTVNNDQHPQPAPASIPVTITAANQNGAMLNVRSLIETLSGSGSCTLRLTKGTSVVTKTSGIQALSTTSTCKGFDIATSELSPGTWHLEIKVSIGDKTGTAEKDITIS